MTPAAPSIEDLRALFPTAKSQEPLRRHSTWGIGGPADFYVEVLNRPALLALFHWTQTRGVPWTPLGQGSNVLIGDRGVRGVVFRLRGDFETLRFDGDVAEAGAGVLLPQLSRRAAERGLTGAEPLCGIPGTLGGGLRTNAGTPEGNIGQLVESVDVLDADGRIQTLPRDQLRLSYRQADLGGRLVLSARLKLRPGVGNDILASVEQQLARRAERQPLGTKNCGSVFKNPPGDFAARLIDAAGLKGYRLGDARVSPKHANFIENIDRATAADVHRLIDHIRNTVRTAFGVTLELEVWPLGE